MISKEAAHRDQKPIGQIDMDETMIAAGNEMSEDETETTMTSGKEITLLLGLRVTPPARLLLLPQQLPLPTDLESLTTILAGGHLL